MTATTSRTNSERLSVGTVVTIRWGLQNVRGIITENRGAIGVGGRRLYRVDVDLGESSLVVMELPASEIQRVEE